MKNSWLIWFLVVGVVITILVAFNYQDEKGSVPLSEIFPETQETYPANIEYEFVDDNAQKTGQHIVQKSAQPGTSAAVTAAAPAKVSEVAQTEQKTEPAKLAQETATAKDIPLAQAAYSIQVASFKTKDRAQQKVAELSSKDIQGYIVTQEVKGKGTWYRVYVGKFASKTEADKYLPNIQKIVADSFVISLK